MTSSDGFIQRARLGDDLLVQLPAQNMQRPQIDRRSTKSPNTGFQLGDAEQPRRPAPVGVARIWYAHS